MKTLKELKAEMKACLDAAEALTAAEKPDPAAIKAKMDESDVIQAKIEQVKAIQAKRKLAEEPEATVQSGDLGKVDAQPVDHDAEERCKEDAFWRYVRAEAARENPLDPAFKDYKPLSDRERDLVRPRSTSFKVGADGAVIPPRMQARMFGAKVADALGILGKAGLPMAGGVPTITVPTGTGAMGTGGLVQTVPPDFRAMLLELPPEPSHILPLANVVPAPYGSVTWPILKQSDPNAGGAVPTGAEYGGVTGNWIQEGETKPDESAEIDQLTVQTIEFAAYTELTNRLLSRSAIQLEPLLTRLFRDVTLDAYDRAFLMGNGISQPLGILSINPTTGYLGCRLVSRDVANQTDYTDLINIEFALMPYHRRGAIWMIQDQTLKTLKGQKSTTGFPLWVAGVMTGFQAPQPPAIIGYPYISTIRQPAAGARGDVIFGDFSQYIVAMEQEVVIQRSEHYKFKNNVTAFRLSTVVGGKPAQPRAFAALDALVGSTTGAAQLSTTTGGAGLTTEPPD